MVILKALKASKMVILGGKAGFPRVYLSVQIMRFESSLWIMIQIKSSYSISIQIFECLPLTYVPDAVPNVSTFNSPNALCKLLYFLFAFNSLQILVEIPAPTFSTSLELIMLSVLSEHLRHVSLVDSGRLRLRTVSSWFICLQGSVVTSPCQSYMYASEVSAKRENGILKKQNIVTMDKYISLVTKEVKHFSCQ